MIKVGAKFGPSDEARLKREVGQEADVLARSRMNFLMFWNRMDLPTNKGGGCLYTWVGFLVAPLSMSLLAPAFEGSRYMNLSSGISSGANC